MSHYRLYYKNKYVEYPAQVRIKNYVVFKFLFQVIPYLKGSQMEQFQVPEL